MSESYESLKAKDPTLVGFTLGGHRFLVKGPSRAMWDELQSKIDTGRERTIALNRLVRECVVYPPPDELDAILDRKPAYLTTIAGELMDIAGVNEKIEREK